MERLNKILAHAGVGSRRHCDELIAAGRVKVDGIAVTDLGLKVDPEARQIAVDDQPVRSEKPVYWLVNKPRGVLCTNHDPAGRPTVVELLPHVEQRVYTVGRLDEASDGLLLMTNDGELAFQLMHPRYGIEKTYLVQVAGRPTGEDLQKLLDGVWLSDGRVRAANVWRLKSQGNSTWLRVVLREGKNREIRRMLAKLDHKVLRLQRVAIGPVKLDRLPKGKARKLSLPEVQVLRQEVQNARTQVERVAKRAAGGEVASDQSRRSEERRPDARRPVDRRPDERRPDVRRPDDRRGDEPRRFERGPFDGPKAKRPFTARRRDARDFPPPAPPKPGTLAKKPAAAGKPSVAGKPLAAGKPIAHGKPFPAGKPPLPGKPAGPGKLSAPRQYARDRAAAAAAEAEGRPEADRRSKGAPRPDADRRPRPSIAARGRRPR